MMDEVALEQDFSQLLGSSFLTWPPSGLGINAGFGYFVQDKYSLFDVDYISYVSRIVYFYRVNKLLPDICTDVPLKFN